MNYLLAKRKLIRQKFKLHSYSLSVSMIYRRGATVEVRVRNFELRVPDQSQLDSSGLGKYHFLLLFYSIPLESSCDWSSRYTHSLNAHERVSTLGGASYVIGRIRASESILNGKTTCRVVGCRKLGGVNVRNNINIKTI